MQQMEAQLCEQLESISRELDALIKGFEKLHGISISKEEQTNEYAEGVTESLGSEYSMDELNDDFDFEDDDLLELDDDYAGMDEGWNKVVSSLESYQNFDRDNTRNKKSKKKYQGPSFIDIYSRHNYECAYQCVLSKVVLKEALEKKQSRFAIRCNDKGMLDRTLQLIYQIEWELKDYYANGKNQYELLGNMEEVVNNISSLIGYGKRIGKFTITEFAEEIYDKILDLKTWNEITDHTTLFGELEHLLFRVGTYFGKDLDDLEERFSYKALFSNEQLLEEQEPSDLQEDYTSDYWQEMFAICDDYGD